MDVEVEENWGADTWLGIRPCPKKGELLNMTAYKSDIIDILEETPERRPNLIPIELDVLLPGSIIVNSGPTF